MRPTTTKNLTAEKEFKVEKREEGERGSDAGGGKNTKSEKTLQ